MRATARQRESHRPGTTANRNSVIKEYVLFSCKAAFPYDSPAPHQVCWYLEHLAHKGLVHTTIANHLSALRTYFAMAALDRSPLHSSVVNQAMRGLALNLRHTPDPARAVTPDVLTRAMAHLATLQYPHHVRLAVVWMFMAFLRQSNIVPRTTGTFDPTRHLTRDDIAVAQDSLIVSLKWSKTSQKSHTPTTVTVWALPGSPICPVTAYNTLLAHAPTRWAGQPLLQFKDGNSMTSPYIARNWLTLLKAANIPSHKLTLHGLRRGGATYAYHDGDATLEDVMAHGQWASSAVRAYLTPSATRRTSVHRALAHLRT